MSDEGALWTTPRHDDAEATPRERESSRAKLTGRMGLTTVVGGGRVSFLLVFQNQGKKDSVASRVGRSRCKRDDQRVRLLASYVDR